MTIRVYPIRDSEKSVQSVRSVFANFTRHFPEILRSKPSGLKQKKESTISDRLLKAAATYSPEIQYHRR